LNFKAISVWAKQSECGRYFVSLAKVEDRFKHSAFFKPESGMGVCLGTRDDDAEAVRICEEHAEAHARSWK